MKTIILDTDILIDNVHGFATWVDKLLKRPKDYRLVVPTIVVAEYLSAQEVETAMGRDKSDNYLLLFKKQDLTEEIAQILGTIFRRKTYVTSASTADLIIAATVLSLSGELATRNKKDFEKIPELKLFDPKKFNDA